MLSFRGPRSPYFLALRARSPSMMEVKGMEKGWVMVGCGSYDTSGSGCKATKLNGRKSFFCEVEETLKDGDEFSEKVFGGVIRV